jgi:hypothetical protein
LSPINLRCIVDLSVSGGTLVLHVRGADRLWALKSCWDRSRARRLGGGGLPVPPFRLRGGFTVPPWSRFPWPPDNPGRPVFPGPVRDLGLTSMSLPICREVQALVRIRLGSEWFAHGLVPYPRTGYARFYQAEPAPGSFGTAKCPESLCPMLALPPLGKRSSSPERALPLRRGSYGLTRQSPWALLYFGLSLVRRVLAGCYQPLLPTGSSRRYLRESFLRCLVPYPDGSHRVPIPVSSSVSSAFPIKRLGRLPVSFREHDFSRGDFRGCRHSIMFRPPSLLASQIVPTAVFIAQGSRGFYVRAERASLPPHAPNMLAA